MLGFWETEFDQSISKHIKFLKENLKIKTNTFKIFRNIRANGYF